MNLLDKINKQQCKENLTEFNVGDTVKVHVKIVEGETERIQIFTGNVIAMKGGDVQKTFTVRRVSYGQGVERIFPMHSPRIDKVEVMRKGSVRRSKLYDLRDKIGKQARIKEAK